MRNSVTWLILETVVNPVRVQGYGKGKLLPRNERMERKGGTQLIRDAGRRYKARHVIAICR